MIVLDANILIRAVLGRRVRALLDFYANAPIKFYVPASAYHEAECYIPELLMKTRKSSMDPETAVAYLKTVVELVPLEKYEHLQSEARLRLRNRDEDDWPVLALALSLSCPIWTEDTDFFGTGVAVWTSDRIEIFLKSHPRATPSEDL